MKVFLGSDHAGFELKQQLVAHLLSNGHHVKDMGATSFDEDDDYPDFILPVAEAVAREQGTFGIVLGGSGQGEAMAANRVKGARAAVYYGGTLDIVRLAREHNNANILSLGARFVAAGDAVMAVELFLATPFPPEERHMRRIAKLS